MSLHARGNEGNRMSWPAGMGSGGPVLQESPRPRGYPPSHQDGGRLCSFLGAIECLGEGDLEPAFEKVVSAPEENRERLLAQLAGEVLFRDVPEVKSLKNA